MLEDISVSALDKKYGSTWALRNVTFPIERGQCLALAGRNGAGKSTLLRLLAKKEQPSRGVIDFRNLRARNISLVLPSTQLFRFHTVLESMKIIGRLWGLSEEETARRIAGLVEEFDLREALPLPFHVLSSGNRQRVIIAVKLMHHPQLILLDEPTTGLDLQHSEDLLLALKRLKFSGRTVVFSSHHVDEIRQLADRLIIIRDGTVAGSWDRESLIKAGGDLRSLIVKHL